MLPPIRLSSYPVQPQSVFLVEVTIRQLLSIAIDHSLPTELPEGEVGVTVTLARVEERVLVVAITLSLENNPWYEGHATYAGRFHMSEAVPPEEMEQAWQYVASELAPITLYPFLRELLLNLTGRTLAPSVVLPFAPVPLSPGELNIPTTDAEQRVMQFGGSGTFKRHQTEGEGQTTTKRRTTRRKA